MDIREVIQTARAAVQNPGVVVFRSDFINGLGDSADKDAENVLEELKAKSRLPFRIISVLPAVLNLVRSKLKKDIFIREMKVGDSELSIFGYVEEFHDKAIIKIKPGMNLCWKRFTVLKELMHLYSNTCGDSTRDSASLIITAARRSRDVIAKDNSILAPEEAAFYMALEVLLPWELREQLLQLRELGATHYQIAKVFMIPQPMVDHFLEDYECSSYITLSQRLNKNI